MARSWIGATLLAAVATAAAAAEEPQLQGRSYPNEIVHLPGHKVTSKVRRWHAVLGCGARRTETLELAV